PDGNKRRRRAGRRDPAARAGGAERGKGRTRSRAAREKLTRAHARLPRKDTYKGRADRGPRSGSPVSGPNRDLRQTHEPWRTACYVRSPLGPRPGGFAWHG